MSPSPRDRSGPGPFLPRRLADGRGVHRRLLPVAFVAALTLVAAACSLGDSSVTVDSPRLATDVEGARPGPDVVEEAGETIVAPDFEVELEPGEDPELVLDLGLDDLEFDGDDSPILPEPSAVDAPPGAILTLCPAVEAVISAATGDSVDDELTVLLDNTPSELHDAARAVVANPTDTTLSGTTELDAFYLGACSAPLHSGAIQVAALCAGGGELRACAAQLVEDMGGLCFDEAGVMLSCVSGLPALGG